MKLRNKKTGEVIDSIWWDEEVDELCLSGEHLSFYNSLAELNEVWEDYKEKPKGNWTIDPVDESCIDDGRYTTPDELERYEELGLRFETEVEAEKAVEKLKAWKRLRDKNFKFYGWNKGSLFEDIPNNITFACDDTRIWAWEDIQADLDLLFGEEE